MKRLTLAIGVAAILIPLDTAASRTTASPTTSSLTTADHFDTLMRHLHENGMFNGNVLVKERGEIVYAHAFGLADRRDERPLDLDTAFYLASLAKPFTATAVLMLAEEETLFLADRLTTFVPDFPAYGENVTIHNLLSHTSGVPGYADVIRDAPDDATNVNVLEVLKARAEPEFPPGWECRYSNGNDVLLAQVVESASGVPFATFVRSRIFEPLGMTRTWVQSAATPPLENRAVGFGPDGELDDYRPIVAGSTDIYSTVRDLSRWDDALAAHTLLSEETTTAAFEPVTLADGSTGDFGYGWAIREIDGRRYASHAGGFFGYRAVMLRDLDRRNTIILLTNMGDTMDFGRLLEPMLGIFDGVAPALPLATKDPDAGG
jgi:CubicO group peptidase (beta-lactamase class C family)